MRPPKNRHWYFLCYCPPFAGLLCTPSPDARGLCTGSCPTRSRRGTRHGTAVSLVPDFEAAAHWPGSPTRTQAESTSPPSDSTAQVALIEPAKGLAAYPAMTPTGHAAFGVQNSNLKQNQGPKVLDSSLARGPLQCQSEHYSTVPPYRSCQPPTQAAAEQR